MYNFEVHLHAPELNKVFYKGHNISKLFSNTILTSLSKDYIYNVQLIRESFNNLNKNLKRYKLQVFRPDNSLKTGFCSTLTSLEALEQLKKAKQYYNIEGTKLVFKRYYN